jgi:zinc transporter ZupT
VILAEPLLPYALGFAAGAMIGFAVMMVLDVAFG